MKTKNIAKVVTNFQALAADSFVMLNLWTKFGIPQSWIKRNFLGWSFAWLDDQNERHPLRSWVPFEGQTNEKWLPALHDVRPIQGTSWFHFDPERKARYQVAPVFGTPENPQVDLTLAVQSDTVDVNGSCGDYLDIATNFGLPSTQWAARKVPKDASGRPSKTALLTSVAEINNPIRIRMAGNILPTLRGFFQKAHDIGGKLVGGVYEFTDKEVRGWAIDLAKSKGGGMGEFTNEELDRLAVILSTAGDNDAENAETRAMLHGVSKEVWDRFVASGHIGHNKFWILLDQNGKPIEVLTGSTNFTPTGLCGQANLMWIIKDARVAAKFLEYWNMLREDTEKNNSRQGPDLREFCHQKFEFEFEDGTTLVLFFSPNTTKASKKEDDLPIDLAFIRDEILPHVEESMLFAFFQPGKRSLINLILAKAKENQNLVTRGVVSSNMAMPDATELFHRNGDDPVIVPATAFNNDFGDFERELLALGFAIIHLKMFVFDMFGLRPVVMGGSHNGGIHASDFNDENMEIWIGNRVLAIKVGVYILSLYRHFRERYMMAKQASAFSGFLKRDSSWIDAAEWTPGTAKCREKALFAGAMTEFNDPAYAVKGEASDGSGIGDDGNAGTDKGKDKPAPSKGGHRGRRTAEVGTAVTKKPSSARGSRKPGRGRH
jgi:hypothetical protein